MQEAQARPLIQEDPKAEKQLRLCTTPTEPVLEPGATTAEATSCSDEAHRPERPCLCSAARGQAMRARAKQEPRLAASGESPCSNEEPAQPESNK